MLTPALNDVNPNYITIPIKVRDATNTGKSGVAVTLSGTGVSTTSQLTDNNGCVLFANVPPGNYTRDGHLREHAGNRQLARRVELQLSGWYDHRRHLVEHLQLPVGHLGATDAHADRRQSATKCPRASEPRVYNANLSTANGIRTYPTTGTSVVASRPVPVQLDLLRLGELGRSVQ